MKKNKYHGNIKCDCGHKQSDHYNGEGWCHDSTHKSPGSCGCTFFYPNINYIKRKNKEKQMKLLKEEDYVYKDLEFNMSTKKMADVLYAGIMTDARFTILWTLGGKDYNRKQNAYNSASIKVHIHPDLVEEFEALSGLSLEEPTRISLNDGHE